jgi:ribonuclease T1
MKTELKRTIFAGVAAIVLLTTSAAFAATKSCALSQSIAVRELPKQGQETLALIDVGGPFASNRDGIAFNNRERILPKEKRGYYREYTVRTPGVKNRGARRIVCGGNQRVADACYYSDDHYQSFKCIAR